MPNSAAEDLGHAWLALALGGSMVFSPSLDSTHTKGRDSLGNRAKNC